MKVLSFLIIFSWFSIAQESLMEFGQAPSLNSKDSKDFILITWNIYKGQKENLYTDLGAWAEQADFLLLQEFLLNSEQKDLMKSLDQTHWALAPSFRHQGEWTGVATMSRWQPFDLKGLRSPATEPLVHTPKMTLITKYKIQGAELWLVNLHGLNFDITHVSFEEQIDDVVRHLVDHSGPLIFAGDFNTWTQSRLKYLLLKTKNLGLERLPLESPTGLLSQTLDHIFCRQIVAKEFQVLSSVQSSDHFPLWLRFEISK